MSDIRGIPQVPRLPGQRGEAGGFLLVQVVSQAGSDSWKVVSQGQVYLIRSRDSLTTGQFVRVPRGALENLLSGGPIAAPKPAEQVNTSLATLLLMTQGLPVVSERLRAMEAWAKATKARLVASETDSWMLGREARPWVQTTEGNEALLAWLTWEKHLMNGEVAEPPENELFDLWNSLRPDGTGQWLVCPFDWEAENQIQRGLLKAWIPNPETGVENWTVLTCPGNVPIRVTCAKQPPGWKMALQIFDEPTYQKMLGSWKILERNVAESTEMLELVLLGPLSASPSGLKIHPLRSFDDTI